MKGKIQLALLALLLTFFVPFIFSDWSSLSLFGKPSAKGWTSSFWSILRPAFSTSAPPGFASNEAIAISHTPTPTGSIVFDLTSTLSSLRTPFLSATSELKTRPSHTPIPRIGLFGTLLPVTETPVATNTPRPTSTPPPADTDTPRPNTPRPTNTPRPADTNTPVPPSATNTRRPTRTNTPIPPPTDTPINPPTNTPPNPPTNPPPDTPTDPPPTTYP
jgi:hypothetical protein